MALNQATLAAAILKAFRDASAAAANVEELEEIPAIEEDLANALAGAIDAFVRSGDVSGVQVSVAVSATTSTENGHSHTVSQTVTGTQSNTVKLS